MHHPHDRIGHTTAFVTPVVEHWLEREKVQWVHPMKDRSDDPSHHERTLLPRNYISLPALSLSRVPLYRVPLKITIFCGKIGLLQKTWSLRKKKEKQILPRRVNTPGGGCNIHSYGSHMDFYFYTCWKLIFYSIIVQLTFQALL